MNHVIMNHKSIIIISTIVKLYGKIVMHIIFRTFDWTDGCSVFILKWSVRNWALNQMKLILLKVGWNIRHEIMNFIVTSGVPMEVSRDRISSLVLLTIFLIVLPKPLHLILKEWHIMTYKKMQLDKVLCTQSTICKLIHLRVLLHRDFWYGIVNCSSYWNNGGECSWNARL